MWVWIPISRCDAGLGHGVCGGISEPCIGCGLGDEVD
jgi:hypothetical protein